MRWRGGGALSEEQLKLPLDASCLQSPGGLQAHWEESMGPFLPGKWGVGAYIQEEAHHIRLATQGCFVQGGSCLRLTVNVYAGLEQKPARKREK